MRWLLTACFLLVLADVHAQESNLRCRPLDKSATISDSLIIVPNTIYLKPASKEEIHIVSVGDNTYKIKLTNQDVKGKEVCYRVLPTEFSTRYANDSTRYYDSTAFFTDPGNGLKANQINEQRQELFDLGDLNRSGQISRGIATGNTQNLTVNSSLNLNLEGKLSDDLSIKAIISDQRIPYQPEGNTQQLQEFDKVYVQLYTDKFSVTGGDVVLQNGTTHFMKYRKNVLGGSIEYTTEHSKTNVSASSAKGQFVSVAVPVQEGVYGPYQIPPPENYAYSIIIANSEKVYLDGKLLIRGFDNDYTIDYNQAEIEFTSNVLLTQYSRIRIDYEYANQNYARSIVTASHQQKLGALTLGVNYYQEKDNRNKSLSRVLSDTDKSLLSLVGDSLNLAIVPGSKLVEYSEDRILYYKKDTVVNGNVENIFVYTTEIQPEVYSVEFTDIGEGKGSYSIQQYVSNGRVYEWVGSGNGAYVPYVLLAAPNSKQMISISADASLNNYSNVYFETSFSKNDKNLFSELHKEDDNGLAALLGYNINKKPLGKSKYILSTKLEGEFINKDFTIIDRFRKVEFDRDWGISSASGNSLGAEDQHYTALFEIEKDNLNRIGYEGHYRNKSITIEGFQHRFNLAKSLGIFQVDADAFLMDGVMPELRTQWRKFHGEGFIRGKIQPGYRYQLEQNLTVRPITDSIVSSQNYFEDHQFFVRSNFSASTNFEITYGQRFDKIPELGELIESTKAETVSGKLSTMIHNNHSIKFVLNYRNLVNVNDLIPNIKSVTGRLDWTGEVIPNVLRNELNYSISNARVPKREYVFIEVPTGEGTHTWRDDNGDEVKDLDEFYEAFNYDERRYIKLYVPSSNYVDAYNNRFNYQLHLRFPKSWKSDGGIRKYIGAISNTTAWTTQYSTTEDNLSARLVPFLADIDTAQLLSARESFRSTLFINRNDPQFGMNIGYQNRSRKILYANGFEGRKDTEYSATVRWSIHRSYQFEVKGFWASHANRSDYLDGRNYDIEEVKFGPTAAWQPKPTFRVTTTYSFGQNSNLTKEQNQDQALINELLSEVRIGSATRFMMNAQLKYTQISFNGDEQNAVGYELLKGLKPGNNVSWVLSWRQRLVNGLQIQVYYEGRKPDGLAVIHSMRASINALF